MCEYRIANFHFLLSTLTKLLLHVQITQISIKLKSIGIEPNDDRILRILRGGYASGNVHKALELLRLWEDASVGLIKDYSPDVKLLGSENNSKVSCYLDSLLFALYANLDAFEVSYCLAWTVPA